ncbi:MAG: tetratricopeptide repeat protein [Candidatus Midichloria sp.]
MFKEDNEDVVYVYNNIALAHYLRNDYDLALVMLQKSLVIQLKLFGENIREVATILAYICYLKLKAMQ